MTIYIIGPMRGIPYYNFPAFDAMEKRLREEYGPGVSIFNPASMDRAAGLDPKDFPADYDWNSLPSGITLDEIVERDVHAILKATYYVALPGWEKSTGATAEKGLLDWKKATRLDPETLHVFGAFAPLRFEPHSDWKTAPYPGTPVAGTNPKDILGMKKPPLRLVPPIAELYLSRAMGHGAGKYGPWNWRGNKVLMSVYIEAAKRHLLALLDGQDTDDESGLPHQAHVMACMAIILDAEAVGAMVDDRNKSGKVSDLIKQLTEKA